MGRKTVKVKQEAQRRGPKTHTPDITLGIKQGGNETTRNTRRATREGERGNPNMETRQTEGRATHTGDTESGKHTRRSSGKRTTLNRVYTGTKSSPYTENNTAQDFTISSALQY